MRALEGVVTFRQLSLDPSADQIAVTVALDDLNIRSALRAILDAAEVNYVLLADEGGNSVRLVASRRAFAGRLDQRSAEAQVEHAPVERVEHRDTASNSAPSAAEPRESHGTFTFGTGGQIGGSAATGGNGSFSTGAQTQALEHALMQPALPRTPGTVVQLPFPDVLGAPRVSVVPPKDPSASAVPLPGISTSPQPQPQGPPGLSDALSPKPRR
jgi:hypothetical protein